ncbi:MAG: helix-turn-helix domain-containing protein [Alphaproteobacteria bacterium]|nr:MAG: helix-turn-helix domain-containing protein [Alphaproteobacteria bacterium]
MMWLSARHFARVAGLDRTSAARICKDVLEGRDRRDHLRGLEVRLVAGQRGGNSGKRYEIKIASLPGFLRDAVTSQSDLDHQGTAGVSSTATPPSTTRTAYHLPTIERRASKIAARFKYIRHALSAPRGSEDRHMRVLAAASVSGRSRATIYRWIDLYEASGLRGLAPAAGRKLDPPVVSRAFDKAFVKSFGQVALGEVGAEIDKIVPALWTKRESRPGMNRMAIDVGTHIEAMCSLRGWDMGAIDYRPSLSRIRQFRRFELARIFLTDANRLHEMLPRIRRNWEQVAPMEIVFVDVKFADMHVMDGEERIRPAIVGFLDAGTGRLFAHLVRVVPRDGDRAGTSVRSEQVLEAFGHMLCSRDWGLPQTLYMDNGQENVLLETAQARLAAEAELRIVHAGPHEPQAKVIEGFFAHLNKHVFAPLRAFNGGKPHQFREKRRDKRAPTDPGDWKSFCEKFALLLSDYHAMPRTRAPSPQRRFVEKRRVMKRPLDVWQPDRVAATFGSEVSRRVRQGWLVRSGERYTGEHLFARHGERVRVIDAVVDPETGMLDPCCSREGPAGAPYVVADDGALLRTALDHAMHPLDDAATGKHVRNDRHAHTYNEIARLLMEAGHTHLSDQEKYAVLRTASARFRRGVNSNTGGPASPSVTTPPCGANRMVRDAAREMLNNLLPADNEPQVFDHAPLVNTRIFAAMQHQLARAVDGRSNLVISSYADLGITTAAHAFCRKSGLNWLYAAVEDRGGAQRVLSRLENVFDELLSPSILGGSNATYDHFVSEGGLSDDRHAKAIIVVDGVHKLRGPAQVQKILDGVSTRFDELDPILVLMGDSRLRTPVSRQNIMVLLTSKGYRSLEFSEDMLDDTDFNSMASFVGISPARTAWCRELWDRGVFDADYLTLRKVAAALTLIGGVDPLDETAFMKRFKKLKGLTAPALDQLLSQSRSSKIRCVR